MKSRMLAILLCLSLGWIGVHRFYLGYTFKGLIQLLTLGGFGIWAFIDFIRLLTGSLSPQDSEWGKTETAETAETAEDTAKVNEEYTKISTQLLNYVKMKIYCIAPLDVLLGKIVEELCLIQIKVSLN